MTLDQQAGEHPNNDALQQTLMLQRTRTALALAEQEPFAAGVTRVRLRAMASSLEAGLRRADSVMTELEEAMEEADLLSRFTQQLEAVTGTGTALGNAHSVITGEEVQSAARVVEKSVTTIRVLVRLSEQCRTEHAVQNGELLNESETLVLDLSTLTPVERAAVLGITGLTREFDMRHVRPYQPNGPTPGHVVERLPQSGAGWIALFQGFHAAKTAHIASGVERVQRVMDEHRPELERLTALSDEDLAREPMPEFILPDVPETAEFGRQVAGLRRRMGRLRASGENDQQQP